MPCKLCFWKGNTHCFVLSLPLQASFFFCTARSNATLPCHTSMPTRFNLGEPFLPFDLYLMLMTENRPVIFNRYRYCAIVFIPKGVRLYRSYVALYGTTVTALAITRYGCSYSVYCVPETMGGLLPQPSPLQFGNP